METITSLEFPRMGSFTVGKNGIVSSDTDFEVIDDGHGKLTVRSKPAESCGTCMQMSIAEDMIINGVRYRARPVKAGPLAGRLAYTPENYELAEVVLGSARKYAVFPGRRMRVEKISVRGFVDVAILDPEVIASDLEINAEHSSSVVVAKLCQLGELKVAASDHSGVHVDIHCTMATLKANEFSKISGMLVVGKVDAEATNESIVIANVMQNTRVVQTASDKSTITINPIYT